MSSRVSASLQARMPTMSLILCAGFWLFKGVICQSQNEPVASGECKLNEGVKKATKKHMAVAHEVPVRRI